VVWDTASDLGEVSPGTTGQILTSNGPSAYPTYQTKGAVSQLTTVTGDTVDAYGAAKHSSINSGGVHGTWGLQNTGGSNGLTYETTYTDIWGVTGTVEANLAFGATVDHGAIENVTKNGLAWVAGAPNLPITTFSIKIKSQTAGNPTSYSFKISKSV
jgi:hypothetical protein